MSKRKIDPHTATRCAEHNGARGWFPMKQKAKSDEVRVAFRSKEKPRPRGAIHALADQMLKEDINP